jgi:hypothetical protein
MRISRRALGGATLAVTVLLFAPAQAHLLADAPMSYTEERFITLVIMRLEAIEGAFGPLFGPLRKEMRVKFVSAGDATYASATPAAYEGTQHMLIFRRELQRAVTHDMLRAAAAYWPYYQNAYARGAFPLVEIVDDALWTAHLQESAQEHGLSWPHDGCNSTDVAQRLGCEMLMAGVRESVRSTNGPLFNLNRIDRLWPEDLRVLYHGAWRRNDRDYGDVRRLGGISLIQPLVRQFGAPRVFAYVAQTPFRIEENNVKLSALRYQERARSALQL